MGRERLSGLVLDASVLINVIATDIPGELLRSAGAPVYVPSFALSEVKRDPRGRATPEEIFRPLLRAGVLSVIELSAEEAATFIELVGADPADALDDGESAVIACAHHRGHGAALDDAKALRITWSRFPAVTTFFSVDLFEMAQERGLVSAELARPAFEDARRYARMRVPKTPPHPGPRERR